MGVFFCVCCVVEGGQVCVFDVRFQIKTLGGQQERVKVSDSVELYS